MNFFGLSALVNGIAATLLGGLVFARAPRDPRHRAYGLFCVSLCIWSYGYFAWQLTDAKEPALLYVRLLMVGAILIPTLYLYHMLTFLDLVHRHKPVLLAGAALSGIFLALDATPLMVADLQPVGSFPLWPRPGPAFHAYIVWFAGYVSYTTAILWHSYRSAKGLKRNQYLYLVVGSIIGYGGGVTNFFLWYDIPIPPYGTLLLTLYTAMIAYSMARYRLFDFSMAVQKGLALLLLLALIVAPSYLVLEVAQTLYFGAVNYQFSAILLILLVVSVTVAYHVKTGAQAAIARALFKHQYDTYEMISAFSKTLITNLDLHSLTEEIVRTVSNVFRVFTVSLYLYDKERGAYGVASSVGAPSASRTPTVLHADDALVDRLRTGAILVREEIEHPDAAPADRSLAEVLRGLDTDLCIPLVNKDRLIGLCCLGTRLDSRMYSEEDLGLLTTLAHNAAIALDNATLYEDLRRSQILMRRADRLRSLETVAGGFAHEVRNPLTSIKTFVQLAPERKSDEEFMGTFSKVVEEDVARIERLIQEILDYARYKEPTLTEEDLNDIAASCLYFLEVKAGSKAIVIRKDLCEGLPPVKVDRQQIRQVLLNLFLNAMDAMAETGGHLTVRTGWFTKPSGSPWVQIEVTDTGSGIAAEDLDHIFDPFYTTKHESGEREGTGLGLTIVHQIVQDHHGFITVRSTVGKGTTFLVNLPADPHYLQSQAAGLAVEHGQETADSARR